MTMSPDWSQQAGDDGETAITARASTAPTSQENLSSRAPIALREAGPDCTISRAATACKPKATNRADRDQVQQEARAPNSDGGSSRAPATESR